jgi:hypothetical protein
MVPLKHPTEEHNQASKHLGTRTWSLAIAAIIIAIDVH